MAKHREYDDDDGRTVADMSGLEGQHLFLPRLPKRRKDVTGETPPQPDHPQPTMSREEKRIYTLAALKAGLLIALTFIVGFGLFIALIILLWNLKKG